MQRILVILILVVFSASEFRPLFHLADYAINYEYISTELCIEKDLVESCCKGKCYLNNQLAKAVAPEEDSSSERRAPKIEWEKTPMLIFASEKLSFFEIQDERNVPIIRNDAYFDDIFLNTPTPPPRS
ncbi:MAG: hypothetical protein P8P74_12350 [Crocinitomicaceae bacterium]|nr:hypothetical protein [Crocinitomicaceae bacterium]